MRSARRHAVLQIRHKLESEFGPNISLEEPGRRGDLDALYLIRGFKKALGVAPPNHLTQKRTAQRLRLLRAEPHEQSAQKLAGVTLRSFRAGLPSSID